MRRLLPIVLLAGVLAGGVIFLRRSRATVPLPGATISRNETPPPVVAHVSPLTPAQPVPETKSAVSLPDEISRALRSGSSAGQDRAFNVLLPELIAQNEPAAGRLAAAWESGPLRDELIRQIARHWAVADIRAVMTWLTTLSAPDQHMAAEAVIAQVRQSDPAGALEVSELFHVGQDDGRAEHIMQLWTEENPVESIDWIKSRPAGPLRDRLVARASWVRAQSDPAEAASLVLGRMSAGPARDGAVIAVVRQWAVRDPVGAAAWVGQFPSGPLLNRAQAELETARKLR